LDKIIEEREGRKITQIFSEKGETYFRRIESSLIEEFLRKDNIVLALGGGAVADTDNLNLLLNNGILIYLYLTPKQIYDRVKNNSNRPLLEGLNSAEEYLVHIKKLLNNRSKYYESAQIIVNAGAQKPQGVAEIIINELEKINE
jgi:shikimate kinase